MKGRVISLVLGLSAFSFSVNVPENFRACYLQGYNDAVEEITSSLGEYVRALEALTDFRVRMIAGEVPAPRIRVVVERVRTGPGTYEIRKRIQLDMGDEDLVRYVELISGKRFVKDGYVVYVHLGEVPPEERGYLKKVLQEQGYEVRIAPLGLEVGKFLTVDRAFREKKRIERILSSLGDFEIRVEERLR